MFGLGMWELILILVICLVVFGASRLPEIGKALGKGLKEFKKATNEFTNSDDEQKEDTPEKKS